MTVAREAELRSKNTKSKGPGNRWQREEERWEEGKRSRRAEVRKRGTSKCRERN